MSSRELNILIKAKNLAGGAIKGVKSELKGLDKTLGKGLSSAGKNLEKGLVIGAGAAAAGIGYAVTQAINFEDAFAGVKKTVDATDLKKAGLSFDKLAESFRAMSREIPISVEELAQIGEAAGALGIPAKDIQDFTKVVATLTVTTDLSADDAATSLGQLGNVLHLSGKDFDTFADSLVALGNNGASTEPQIIEIAKRFGAAGHSAGLATSDILALASTTASMGVEVEAGGSALSRVFNNIATGIGTGSAKAEAFADSLGLSAKQFKKAWAKDAIGTFDEFLERLSKLDQFDAAALLKSVGITNTRDVSAVRLLSQGYKELNKQIGVSRNATGAMDKEAQQRYATTKSQLQVLKNNLNDAAITIGQAILPQLKELSQAAVGWIQGHQPQIKQFAQDVASGLRQAVTWASKLDWGAIGNTLKALGAVGKTLLDVFLGMPSWVQVAVATGWGLNKFTGGAVGTIVGELGKGLIKGVLGMNAGVVNINAGVVNGGGGGVPGAPGGGGGFVKGAIKFVLPIAAGVLIANAIKELSGTTDEQQHYQQTHGQFGPRSSANVQPKGMLAAPAGTLGSKPLPVADASLVEVERRNASEYNQTIIGNLARLSSKVTAGIQSHANADRQDSMREQARIDGVRTAAQRGLAANMARLDGVRATAANIPPALSRIAGIESGHSGSLNTIAHKNFSPNVHVTAYSSIRVDVMSRALSVNSFVTESGRRGGVIQ